ncbi:30S ribosomal protein S11 [Candidatus Riflebacteria bacterium]
MAKDKKEGRRKKIKKNVAAHAVAHVSASFNNTIISITDKAGNVLCWSSAGEAGFKGSRKSTPYAAQIAAEKVGKTAMDMGVVQVDVFVDGPGISRESAIRSLQNVGLRVCLLKDVTRVPHNGCRPPKRRRV